MKSGYDNNQIPLQLMKGRLGVYQKSLNDDISHYAEGQESRLSQHGGNVQQERMIRDKRRSLDSALKYSYQGADVIKKSLNNNEKIARALINPNKLKQDYDDKIISIGYEHDYTPGTIFEWLGTKTYWIIYLQDLTELAYFRGDIRKCNYEISWQDETGEIYKIPVAVRGPVETKINFIQKHGISVDVPNYSLSILMPKNEKTLEYFKRYKKFYLQDNETCWRVEATDSISTPGILEVIAVEYYSNKDEDDLEAGIVGKLVFEEQEKANTALGNNEEVMILGEVFIKIKKTYVYQFLGEEEFDWFIDSSLPIEMNINKENSKEITLKWNQGYSGQFDLCYGPYKKTIVVESLF